MTIGRCGGLAVEDVQHRPREVEIQVVPVHKVAVRHRRCSAVGNRDEREACVLCVNDAQKRDYAMTSVIRHRP